VSKIRQVERIVTGWDCGEGHFHKNEKTARWCAERRVSGKKSSRDFESRSRAATQKTRDARTRYFVAASLRHDGLTYRAIGEHLGVGRERADFLAHVGEREMAKYFCWLNDVACAIQAGASFIKGEGDEERTQSLLHGECLPITREEAESLLERMRS
jgi:hypothetical protein